VSTAPFAPGVTELFAAARAEAGAGADVSVLFTGHALAAIWDAATLAGLAVAACARSARDQSVTIPDGVRPSSLVAFLRDRPDDARLWCALG
jgi:hypothetical protein